MIAITGFMLLWFIGIKFSKASESFIDETKVEQQTQDAMMHLNNERLDQVSSGGSSPFETQHSSFVPQSQSFKSKGKEGIEYCNNQEHSFENGGKRLSKKRRIEIDQNLARYQVKRDSLKAEGEPMRKMFDVIMNNEHMLRKYGQADEGKSISLILKILKEVQRDINEVIQIRFRAWAGLGGRVLAPACKDKTGRLSQKLAYQPSDVQEEEDSHPQLRDEIWETIKRKAVATRVQDLNNILHGVKFLYHMNLRSENLEKVRAIKLCFEKCIFQAIGFMYKSGLIDADGYRTFFSTSKTLDLIGKHLVDLFPIVKYGLYHQTCFIPNIEHLGNHWRTKHLHHILRDLGNAQRAHIVGTSLVYNVKVFRRAMRYNEGNLTSYWSSSIDKNFLKKLFSDLERLQEGPSTQHIDSTTVAPQLYEAVERLIAFFQEPVYYAINWEHSPVLMVNEFILNYHIIHFIKTYYKQYLGDLFMDDILENQIELFQEGIRIQQMTKRAQTYSSIISHSDDHYNLISREFAMMELKHIMNEYPTRSENYKRLENYLSKFSRENTDLQKWFQGQTVSRYILLNFHRESESWEHGMTVAALRRRDTFWMHWCVKMKYNLDTSLDKEILNLIDPNDCYL